MKEKDKSEKCCGNCKNFKYEDIWGCGYCWIIKDLIFCNGKCAEWKTREGDSSNK